MWTRFYPPVLNFSMVLINVDKKWIFFDHLSTRLVNIVCECPLNISQHFKFKFIYFFFFQDLDSVLHDSKYTENAIKYGSVLNDQITRPLDRAIWWIEHIMRHPFMYQGKSPVNKLYWFQYFLLDVIAFYLFIIYVVFKIIKFIVCKLCCSSSQKAKND